MPDRANSRMNGGHVSVSDVLSKQQNQLADNDIAALADWAHSQKGSATDRGTQRGLALIREGADLVLRRRAALNTRVLFSR